MATHDHAHHPATTTHGHHVPGADKRPAFMGLIVGGIALFAILFGTVKLTQATFPKHEGGKGGEHAAPAAEAAKH